MKATLCTLLFLSQSVGAAEFVPFAIGNRSPIVLVYGLAPPSATADVAYLAFDQELANVYTAANIPREGIELDGEIYVTRLAAGWRRGDWRYDASVPFISHGGGFLDHAIDEWHSIFGFDSGGRETAPRDRLRYAYVRDGRVVFERQTPVAGVGDVQLGVAHGSLPGWRAGLKLPTGDAWLGSGAFDASVEYHAARAFLDARLHGWYRVGGLWLGRGDLWPEGQRRSVAFADAALSYPVTASTRVQAQVGWHTPFYRDSALPQFGASAQLGLGMALQATDDWLVQFGFTEDVRVGTAADVGFFLRVSTHSRRATRGKVSDTDVPVQGPQL